MQLAFIKITINLKDNDTINNCFDFTTIWGRGGYINIFKNVKHSYNMQYMYQNLQMTCKSHDFTSRNPEMYTVTALYVHR